MELNIEVVNLDNLRISSFDYEHRNRNDDFESIMKRVLGHDQIIFATPVYWYSVSPAMKVFLDRLSDFLELPDLLAEGRRLRGKNAFVVCTSISDEPSAAFIEAFRETFDCLGMRFGFVAAFFNCASLPDMTTLDDAHHFRVEGFRKRFSVFVNNLYASHHASCGGQGFASRRGIISKRHWHKVSPEICRQP